jgi:hypothetical protein
MKKVFVILIAIHLLLGSCQDDKSKQSKYLRVSENGRYLETNAGKPFLYLGCTAWELFHRLNREEASEYLKNRAEKGFTVIQAVVLAEIDGLRTPNPYGEVPLIDLDPTKPTEKYFEHVDFIVNKAEELGLYIAILPTWGDKVVPNENAVAGNAIFNVENANIYGEFLGNRYKDKPIIWILGGDRKVHNDTVFQIWKAMAKGLRVGDEGKHLITFHPNGGQSSSVWFHNEPWLDFNMYQSGHSQRFTKVYDFATKDYNLQPVKPLVDGEPAYEDIPIEFWKFCDWSTPLVVPAEFLNENKLLVNKDHFKKGFFNHYDVRVHGYWNLLSGACGYTYGNNAIWQMFKKGSDFAIPCLYDWRESMDRPGANAIKHIRKLFETRSFAKLVPDQSVIEGDNPKDSTHIRAAVANDGSFVIAYLSVGQPVTINMGKISGEKIKAYWYNPRTGEPTLIGEFKNKGSETYTPPTSGIDNDWVLVLDDMLLNEEFLKTK